MSGNLLNLKLENGNSKLENSNSKLENGNSKLEKANLKLEIGNLKLETRKKKRNPPYEDYNTEGSQDNATTKLFAVI